MMMLADRQHKTLAEIEAMPAPEFALWCSYFQKIGLT